MKFRFGWAAAALSLAVCLPLMLAWDVAPIVGVVQQHLSLAGWGLFVLLQGVAAPQTSKLQGWPRTLLILLVAMAGFALWQSQRLSGSPDNGLLAAAMLLAMATVFWSGGSWHGQDTVNLARVFFWALVIAGLFNALVCLIQVLAPQVANDVWIASGSLPGRGNGNLRQPNHLAALLLWALVALVALVGLTRLSWRAALPQMFFLVLAIILSGSRLGLLGCAMLIFWAAVDRRLSKEQCRLLWSLLGCLAVAWLVATLYARWHTEPLLINQRLLAWEGKSTRGQLWAESWQLIAQNPLTGVGWGEFNFAWTLSPKLAGQVHYFGNAHNLPLQLAVELGLPMALTICMVAIWIIWLAARNTWSTDGDLGLVKRAAFVMLAVTAIHSLLEYPLWYAVLALPAAKMLGLLALENPAIALMQQAPSKKTQQKNIGLIAAGVLMICAASFAAVDYQKIANLAREKPQLDPLSKLANLAQARGSLLYSWVAFRATARNMPGDPLAAQAARYAAHGAMDVDLMIAWAQALNTGGQNDKASYLAQRIAEFQLPEAQKFLEVCKNPDEAGKAYQCLAPQGKYTFEDFR